MEFSHIPVMKDEVISGLNLKDGGIYFDGTLGGGGHTYEILRQTSPNGKVVATDKDEDALRFTGEKLAEFNDRIILVHDDFKNVKKILSDLNIEKIDGALLDLGVSSYQLDNKERGFSYMSSESKLDMRMDFTQKFSAYNIVNEYSQQQLFQVINDYGEEKFARNIAKNIVEQRALKPIETTGELVEIIDKSIPFKFKKTGGHPAKRTFQAIRIEVNGELRKLRETMFDFVSCLKKGGRFAVITFHSLEDRIVKQAFKYLELDCICDKNMPICVCDKVKEIKFVNKKPIIASEEEMSINPRSKSAKLRVIEKIVD